MVKLNILSIMNQNVGLILRVAYHYLLYEDNEGFELGQSKKISINDQKLSKNRKVYLSGVNGYGCISSLFTLGMGFGS